MQAIFLDRDGVINRDPGNGGYVTSWGIFEFLPGSLQALKQLHQAGYNVIVISNQAGVAKGLYTKQALDQLTRNMQKEIAAAGGKLCSVNYCLHQDSDNCNCRKPKTGMLDRVARELDIDFSQTYFVGDNRRDILAGKAVGCRTIFVLSGNTKLENLDVKPDFIAKDLLDAVNKIILKEKK
ncbi:D-glycero-beta-D-manno-heptose 1,7-bisphosphate 7-phosphatase [Candidatus Omnitrophota bacterium]